MDDGGAAQRRSGFYYADEPNTIGASIVRRIRLRAANSTNLVGLLTLMITGTIFLMLTGVTVTTSFIGIFFVCPLVIITSPIWAPVGALLFVLFAAISTVCGFGGAAIWGLWWFYRYWMGMRPPGSEGLVYARSRIFDTANHVKDYAMEYGGYLQSKVKDAAPGA